MEPQGAAQGGLERLIVLAAEVDAALDRLVRRRARTMVTDAGLTATLNDALIRARAAIATVPNTDDEHRAWLLYVIAQRIEAMPLMLAAAQAGNAWRVMQHAIAIGSLEGLSQAIPRERALSRKLKVQEPDALRGRKVAAAAAAGGRARSRSAKGPSDAQLCEEVRALHRRNPRMSWTDVSSRVGERHGLSRPTVQRRAADERWTARVQSAGGNP